MRVCVGRRVATSKDYIAWDVSNQLYIITYWYQKCAKTVLLVFLCGLECVFICSDVQLST